jgi:hypothetical protein
MDIQIFKTKMTDLYYKNIESQAKKNKLVINLPNQIIDIIPETNDIQMLECSMSETQSTTDDYIYRKPWNKLNSIHKIIKVREFVETMTIDIEMKKHLKTQLSDMIKNRQLTKKNDVEYDSINGKIISIPSLQCKTNAYNN